MVKLKAEKNKRTQLQRSLHCEEAALKNAFSPTQFCCVIPSVQKAAGTDAES